MTSKALSEFPRVSRTNFNDVFPVLRSDGVNWSDVRADSGDLLAEMLRMRTPVNAISFLDKPGKHPAFSHSRATVGALCQQFDGSFYQPAIGEIGSHGMRRVRNLRSADLTVNLGFTSNASVSGNDVTLSVAGASYHYLATPSDLPAGTKVFLRMSVACAAGSRTVGVRASNSAAAEESKQVLAVGPTPVSVWLSITLSVTGNPMIGLELRSSTVSGIDTSPGTFTITEPFIQIARPGQLIPDPEYVSRGVPVGVLDLNAIANGDFSDGATGWDDTPGQWTLGSGVASGGEYTATVVSYQGPGQLMTGLKVGYRYLLSWQKATAAGGAVKGRIYLAPGSAATPGSTPILNYDVNAVPGSVEFTATESTVWIGLSSQSGTGTVTWDGLSCKPIAYHGWGVDGVRCFATDEYGNDLTSATKYAHDRANVFGLAEELVPWSAPLSGSGWAQYATPVSVLTKNNGIEVVTDGASEGARLVLTVQPGERYSVKFSVQGQAGDVLLSGGVFEHTGTTASGTLSAGEYELIAHATHASSMSVYFRANANAAGTTTYANLLVRELLNAGVLSSPLTQSHVSVYSGAVANGDGTFSFPVSGANARFWYFEADLVDGSYYDVTFEVLEIDEGAHIFANVAAKGVSVFFGPGQKRLIAHRDDYNSTYRFVDLQVNGGAALISNITLRRVYPVRAAGAVRNPAITNLQRYSNALASWATVLNLARVNDSQILLGRSFTLLTANAATTATYVIDQFNSVSGTAYTAQAKVKAGTLGFIQITFTSGSHGGSQYANIDLSTGLVTYSEGCTCTVEAMPEGIWLIKYTATATTTAASAGLAIVLIQSGENARAANLTWAGTETVLVADVQIEASAVANAFVPTTTTAVALAADASSVDPTLLGYAAGGVFVARHKPFLPPTANNNGQHVIYANGANPVTDLIAVYNQGQNLGVFVIDGGAIQVNQNSSAGKWIAQQVQTMAYRIEANNSHLAADGVSRLTDTSVVLPEITQIYLGGPAVGGAYAGAIEALYYFAPGTITDAQLLALSAGDLPAIAELA